MKKRLITYNWIAIVLYVLAVIGSQGALATLVMSVLVIALLYSNIKYIKETK